jgi:hypothetical protein
MDLTVGACGAFRNLQKANRVFFDYFGLIGRRSPAVDGREGMHTWFFFLKKLY